MRPDRPAPPIAALAIGAALAISLMPVDSAPAAKLPVAVAAPHRQSAPDRVRRQRLAGVASWSYQLQRLDDARLRDTASDLVVIDYSIDGSEPRELWPVEVERFKVQPRAPQSADTATGSAPGRASPSRRRIVLAYLSIGEAEDYRFYWPAAWDAVPPGWLRPDTCRWPGNHVVEFWRREWKDVMFAAPFSYLDRIKLAGFDGVYLDRVDAYQQLEAGHSTARAEMIAFVRELAAAARADAPGFLIVAQNAEELLTDREYRTAIDAVAKEDLTYGLAGDGRRNAKADIDASVALLRRLTAEGKPVLTVEYLRDPAEIEKVRREHRRLGLVPTFASRQLDGGPATATAAAPPGPASSCP